MYPPIDGCKIMKTLCINLCVLAVKSSLYVLFFLCVFVINRIAFVSAFSADHSLSSAESTSAADIREPVASLSGFSRASTLHFVPFQRIQPSDPFAIAAVNMQFVQTKRRPT